MDSGLGLAKFLFPQIPSLANTALLHTLGKTPTSSKWDLRTTLTVQVLRQMMNGKPQSISRAQTTTLKDPGVKGKTWVANATIKAPEQQDEGLREAVFDAIEAMQPEDAGVLNYTKPTLADTEVEWTGFRPDAGEKDPMPDISEQEKYTKMMSEPSRKSETTILYFHGGAYYLCDPSTHRPIVSRLAKECNGRVCSVRYRLAPQTAFPGQLLDALLVYLSLIYPPPGSMHDAVPAKNIVFSGDSAGGNLVFALLQFILQLHRTSGNPKVLFYGKEVEVPLPAGACANSGWLDVSRSMASIESNAGYDYLPPPDFDAGYTSRFPKDDVWPTNPPRGDLFCDLSLLDHPLVSPLAADSWKNSPPMWLCTGQEMLTDEDTIVAFRAATQGVSVHYEEYEAMPHVFAMLLPALPAADRCLRGWGDFCRRCVDESESVKTDGKYIYAKTGKEESIPVEGATTISLVEARQVMKTVKERRIKAFDAENTKTKSAL
ncbi:hypothetical protein LTR37_006808 [Vermiconidia calcicola]|uniref:Uncharacterized protein n=1 Tax=Vermiconidia calcicola TaxID=1690605 RepID=A0ACC3NFT4_9PEZI|nr:hypothetical protein LTR37_006808 [Vermiconidia calcicola]